MFAKKQQQFRAKQQDLGRALAKFKSALAELGYTHASEELNIINEMVSRGITQNYREANSASAVHVAYNSIVDVTITQHFVVATVNNVWERSGNNHHLKSAADGLLKAHYIVMNDIMDSAGTETILDGLMSRRNLGRSPSAEAANARYVASHGEFVAADTAAITAAIVRLDAYHIPQDASFQCAMHHMSSGRFIEVMHSMHRDSELLTSALPVHEGFNSGTTSTTASSSSKAKSAAAEAKTAETAEHQAPADPFAEVRFSDENRDTLLDSMVNFYIRPSGTVMQSTTTSHGTRQVHSSRATSREDVMIDEALDLVFGSSSRSEAPSVQPSFSPIEVDSNPTEEREVSGKTAESNADHLT